MRGLIVSLAVALSAMPSAHGRQLWFDRLAGEQLEVMPPSARVGGTPGDMRIVRQSCRSLPAAGMRRRIVDIAVQEWGFFGFSVVDRTIEEDDDDDGRSERRRRRDRDLSRLGPEGSARVASSIAGYWAITPEGGWILDRQNAVWRTPVGVAADWRDPWSAAFISWVMCEGGLGANDQFRRAIAHYAYIDQAIEARDGNAPGAGFVAYDVGERPVEPGDMLCSARRGAYRSIAERRRELGVGVRSHCDIVIKLDPAENRILAIGGNVRDSVSLKLLPAVFERSGTGQASVQAVGQGRRTIFAHLKLRADSIDADALDTSPTIRVLSREPSALTWLEKQLEGEASGRVQATTSTSLPAAGGARSVL